MKAMFKKMKSERGNALFLILIAVALFAALSYAVTQSGRGGGSVGKEQALILAAQVTQFPSAVRTGVTRMIITGTSVGNLDFNEVPTAPLDAEVFDSSGGGVIWQDPPASSQTAASDWQYLEADGAADGWYVWSIGTNTQDTGREVVAVMEDATLGICEQINRGLGLTATPAVNDTAINFAVAGTAAPAATGKAFVFDAAAGQPFACIQNDAAGAYVYYHTLVEQ